MKTIFTLLLATTVSASAFAYDGGRLSITLPASRNLSVYVDGRNVYDNGNSIVMNNIQPGTHAIAVYRNSGRYNGNSGYGRGNARNDRRGELVYSQNVYVRNSYHVDVMVNRFGKALVDERYIDDRNGNWNDDDWNGNSGYGTGNGGNTSGGYNNGGYNNGGSNGNGYQQAMSESEFNQLLQRLRSSWFGRLGSARDALTTNYFRTEQVRQVLQVFTAESDKLELAKAAYKTTVDRQNYRQLYDLLSYSSQAELDSYIRSNRW